VALRIPHSVLQGQTPAEVCFQTGVQVPQELAAARAQAHAKRLAENRAARCGVCTA